MGWGEANMVETVAPNVASTIEEPGGANGAEPGSGTAQWSKSTAGIPPLEHPTNEPEGLVTIGGTNAMKDHFIVIVEAPELKGIVVLYVQVGVGGVEVRE